MLLWIAWQSQAITYRQPSTSRLPITTRPIEERRDQYVTSDACQACHPHNYHTWHATYHRTMTQLASSETVLAPFAGERITLGGFGYHFHRRGDEYWVEVEQPSRFHGASRVVMTTGSHHYQAYWLQNQGDLAHDDRNIWLIPLVYLRAEQQWVPRVAAFLTPPRIEKITNRWNTSCLRCHSTHGVPRARDPQAVDTRVAEFGIACEACHGPGEQHVALNRNPLRRYRHHLTNEPDKSMVNPSRLDHRRASQVCGQCHAILDFSESAQYKEWLDNGATYRPGEELEDSMLVVRYDGSANYAMQEYASSDDPDYLANQFWSDGMVRISGREYNGLIETPCFQRGELSCLSCHVMHKPADDPRSLQRWRNDQLRLGMEANHACIECHEDYRDETVLAEHSHHAVGSTGSLCYNCHMPYTTYGLLKAIRSHQIDQPSVQASLQTGRPNACNQCHLDKTLQWTADRLHQWYGTAVPELSDDEQTIAGSVLWLLRGDAGQRALMAWSFGWDDARTTSGTEWMAPLLAQLLEDPYLAVRLIAHRSLKRDAQFSDIPANILSDGPGPASAKGRAMEIWNLHRTGAARPNHEHVLLDSAGAIQQDVFTRLLGERDDRIISLAE